MRTIVSILLCAVMLMATATVKAQQRLDIGDQFAFAGLESAKLVPDGAREISQPQIPDRSMDKPMHDVAFFYTGNNAEVITVDQLNTFFANVFAAVKAAATDGKVYEKPYMGSTKLGNEMTEPKKNKKIATGRMSCLYKHNGTWFIIDAEHDSQSRKFTKDYPEQYYGYCVKVQEYFIDE